MSFPLPIDRSCARDWLFSLSLQMSLFMFSSQSASGGGGGGGGVVAYSILWPLRRLRASEEATLDLLRSTAWAGATSVAARGAFVRGLRLPCSLVGGEGGLSAVSRETAVVVIAAIAKFVFKSTRRRSAVYIQHCCHHRDHT